MILIHTHYIMLNTQRITISLPIYVQQRLVKIVPDRQISNFITQIIEEKLLTMETSGDPIEDFFAYRGKLPQKNTKQILAAIHKGRK